MSRNDKARLIESRNLYRGRVVSLYLDRIVEPSGSEVEREVVRHGGAAVLLAVTRERRVVLVRQYRYAADELLLEAPAGTIDPGEDPAETARRELEEETGYHTHRLEKIGEFYPSPGILDELMHLYLATDLEKRSPRPEEDESLEIVEMAVERALELEVGKDLRDAKTLIALSFLRTHPFFATSNPP